jgi:DNA modification methylase
MELNNIYNIDCVEGMKKLPNNYIDLTITSPPYDNLRQYNGFVFNFESVANELYRVTKEGGVVVWVVGDQVINGSESGTSFKQALYFKEIGFNIHDTMIYKKPSTSFPETTRYYQVFEYMFVFSKGKPKTINLIKDKINKWAGQTSFGKSSYREKDGTLTKKEKIHVKDYGVRDNIWEIANGAGFSTTDKVAFEHPAIFPEKLVQDHMITWSNEGDIILDPFMGSGTTAKISILSNRNYIGFELSKEYCSISEERIKPYKQQQTLF